MNIFMGISIVAIGLFMFVSGFTRSENFVYQLFVAKSKILWGDYTHRFYLVAGSLVMVFGTLLALNIIKMK